MALNMVVDSAQIHNILKGFADSIRQKTGSSSLFNSAQEMQNALDSISVGGSSGGGASVLPFSNIVIKRWKPTTDTLYYHVDNTINLSAIAMFCESANIGASGIHSLFCATDPKFKQDQYDNPVGCWSGKSYGIAGGLAAYNYPNLGDIGDDNSSTYFVTNEEYIVILMYGPL